MLSLDKCLAAGQSAELVVGFDLEWMKNFRVANGNRPFCFSFVYVCPLSFRADVEANLRFGLVSKYIEDGDETPRLLQAIDSILQEFSDRENVTIVGHQLSSDISVILNISQSDLPGVSRLRCQWRQRKRDQSQVRVFDTRYDLDHVLTGKSRRLVDVCVECNLDVTQPEIGSSMTDMQRRYLETGDRSLMEKLAVVNIRHSLSAVLLYGLCSSAGRLPSRVNVNQILYNNIGNKLAYMQSPEFRSLRGVSGQK